MSAKMHVIPFADASAVLAAAELARPDSLAVVRVCARLDKGRITLFAFHGDSERELDDIVKATLGEGK